MLYCNPIVIHCMTIGLQLKGNTHPVSEALLAGICSEMQKSYIVLCISTRYEQLQPPAVPVSLCEARRETPPPPLTALGG
uniref:Uncharacterized protein n=1 Tax=Pyxicephalus adspersus TaxID=30357 RepID=A0A499QP85_PYXAD|nr:hypothetical protein maker-66O13-exonerate_protein2genome-gene-0.6 [Pyxicephalus adspersus]